MSQPGNTEIPDRLARQLAGQCVYPGCISDSKPDADYCEPHHEQVKAWRRASAKKRRDLRRAANQCRDCGKPSTRSRCASCRKALRLAARESRRMVQRARRVDQAAPPRGHYKTEVYADGAERTRYVGQPHRGGPTREEQDASAARLVADARAGAQAWLDERIEKQAIVDALPKIQRATGRRLLAARLTYLGRLLIQAGAEYGDDEARALLKQLYRDE